MHTYTSSTITVRNRGSFSFNDYYFLNERIIGSCYAPCAAFYIHGVSINPRIFCGLRQSTLILCSAPRRMMVLGGANSYSRLAVCDSDPTSPDFRSFKERKRRQRMIHCKVWESERDDDSYIDGSVEEMLSLLTDSGGKSLGVKDDSFRKRNFRSRGVCEIQKGIRVDGYSRKDERGAQADSTRKNLKSKAAIKLMEGYKQSRKEGFLRGDNCESRQEASRSSSYSGSSLEDRDNNADRISDNRQLTSGKFIGESSSVYENPSRRERMNVYGRDVRQFQKYEGDVRYRESSGDENAAMDEAERERGWRKESTKSEEKLEIHESDVKKASSSQRLRMKGREENSTSSVNLVHGAREQWIQEDLGQKEIRKGPQKLAIISEIHGSDAERTTTDSLKTFEVKTKDREENSTLSMDYVQEGREQHLQTDQRFIQQTELRKRFHNVTNTSLIQDSHIERTSTSPRVSKTRIRNREDNSAPVSNLVEEGRNQHTQTNQQVFGQTELRKESQKLTNIYESYEGDTERANSSRQLFRTRMNDREENLVSDVNVVGEAREQHSQTDEQVTGDFRSRKESQFHQLTKILEFHESDNEMSSSSQNSLKTKIIREENLVQEAREQQIGVRNGEKRISQVVTPPPPQLIFRRSPYTVINPRPTAHAAQEAFSEAVDSGFSGPYTHLQARNPATHHNLDDRIRVDELIEKDGALGSASRLDESSAQFIGEYVDKIQQEVSLSHESAMESSASEIHKERSSSETTSISQLGAASITKQGSRGSSGEPATKGPSDEMWDVAGTSSQVPSWTAPHDKSSSTVEIVEPTVLTNAGNAVARRSSRSWWSYIADIVRKGWGSARAEPHNSTLKPGARSSSNESVSSDTWFSGHEADVDDDESAKKGKKGIAKEPLCVKKSVDQPHPKQKMIAIQNQEASETSFQGKITQVEAYTSTSMGIVERSSESKGASLAFSKENVGLIEGESGRQGVPFSVGTVDSSLASVGSSPVPPTRLTATIGQAELSNSDQGPSSGFSEMGHEPVRERITEVTGAEGRDGELKQRKLQRNKQVPKEAFDEWEKAYKLESEQRKNDEMYMREALLEAKKAADTWEVPVGAVLVQHGKIIARGCNLVEELRDSTAHAEMICIREASNVLHTWRLAGTTLYVTLEPCAMCAGAILQARIDTVVWGAPNKLLGADGSWVSLFPSGDEGASGSTNRAAGPIHPFHPNMTIRRGVLATECSEAMQQFFQLRRKKKNKKPEAPAQSGLPVSTHPSNFFSKVHDIFSIMFCL